MARTKGTFNISANIETNASAPLDARERVATKADLTASASFPYFYEGMQVYVVSEHKRYTLKGNDPTVLANWVEDGANKADLVDGKIPESQLPSYVDDVIEGYYNTTDEKFYEESTYETEIVGERGKIYVDLGTDPSDSYRWSGSEFSKISGGGVCNMTISYTDFEELPTAEKNNGTAYFVPDRPGGSAIYKNGTWYASGGGGGHTIEDETGTELTQRTTMQFGNGMRASDDSTDEKTVVEADTMPSTDMSEIITPLPSVRPRYQKYSTEEQVVGEWIDGKPLYQKTINFGALPNNTTKTVAHGIANIDAIIGSFGYAYTDNTHSASMPIPFVSSSATTNQLSLSADQTNIYVVSGRDRSNFTVSYITLQYTKTTD